jgi:hypothetical protein
VTSAQAVTLQERPRLGRLYAAALRQGRTPRGGTLPGTVLELPDVTVDTAHLAAYARVCGFPLGNELPPTYPHVLGFPLQVALMAEPGFPFPLAGLVHVGNTVTRRRAVGAGAPLRLRVHAENLAAHPKGSTVDLVCEAFADDESVWQSHSTYLARGAGTPATGDRRADPPEDAATEGLRTAGRWEVRKDTGRRYAAVSGDVNPIHLHPLGARLLGFPGMIAHGMWTKARCLAAIGPRLPEAMTVDVAFRRPLPLPSRPSFAVRRRDGGWDFAVRAATGDRDHVTGSVRPG